MANVSGAGTNYNLPQYIGELYTASPLETPVLQMAGGLNGTFETASSEFPVDQSYAHETAAQPAISEAASQTAPTAITYVPSQDKNVCQIHQESINLTYKRLSNQGVVSGLAIAGKAPVQVGTVDFQIARALEKIARDAEFSFIQGVYNLATNTNEIDKTRGLNAAAGTTLNAGAAYLSKTLMDQILKAAYDAGARFKNSVIVVNAFQKQMLSNIYAYAPMDRNVGGVNIKQIETDFGPIGVVLDPFQATTVLGIFEMSVVKVVSQPVPGKGHMFFEELGKAGAAEKGQIYGALGLDHGPAWMHATITNLKDS